MSRFAGIPVFYDSNADKTPGFLDTLTHVGRTRLRLPTHRGISPLDDSPHSQVLDLLVVVSQLPKQGLGVLADLES